MKGVEIVDVLSSPKFEHYAKTVYELRKSKGLTEEQAREWLRDTCVFSAAMVCAGDAHGYVSGGGNPKGYNTIPPEDKTSLQLFKTAPGIKTLPHISSCSFQIPNGV